MHEIIYQFQTALVAADVAIRVSGYTSLICLFFCNLKPRQNWRIDKQGGWTKKPQNYLAAGVFVLGAILAASALTASAALEKRGSSPSRRLMGLMLMSFPANEWGRALFFWAHLRSPLVCLTASHQFWRRCRGKKEPGGTNEKPDEPTWTPSHRSSIVVEEKD